MSTFLSALQVALPTDPTQLLWLLIIFLIIGLIIIVVLGFLFAFPFAALAAIIVYFLTNGDLFYTGLTFLIVALIVAAIGKVWRTGTHAHEHEHAHEDHVHEDEHEHEHDHEHDHAD